MDADGAGACASLPTIAVLDLPDEMLAASTAHLAYLNGALHAAAWAMRATGTCPREDVAVGLGRKLGPDAVGRLSTGTLIVETTSGHTRAGATVAMRCGGKKIGGICSA